MEPKGLRKLLNALGCRIDDAAFNELTKSLPFTTSFHASAPAVYHNKATLKFSDFIKAIGCDLALTSQQQTTPKERAPAPALVEPQWKVEESVVETQLDGSQVQRVLKRALNPREGSANNDELQLVDVETRETEPFSRSYEPEFVTAAAADMLLRDVVRSISCTMFHL